MKKTHYIIEKTDTKGFYLMLEFLNLAPRFTSILENVSRYATIGIAESIIERIAENGYNFDLSIKKIVVTYEVEEI